MKIQNTDEHAEFQDMGDPISPIPERVTKKRRRPQLLTVLVIVALLLSSYSALNVSGALRGVFPNTEVFSVGVAYSFANSQGSVLLPGSYANVTLTINSAVAQPTTLFLAFNASDQADWGFNNPTHCYNAHPASLQMSFSGSAILPVNSALAAGLNGSCPNGTFGESGSFPQSYQVTVAQGVNNYIGRIDVSPTTTLATTFSVSWTASQ